MRTERNRAKAKDNMDNNNVTIIEALEKALEALEAEGYKSGDVHDDIALVISRLKNKYPAAAKEVL